MGHPATPPRRISPPDTQAPRLLRASSHPTTDVSKETKGNHHCFGIADPMDVAALAMVVALQQAGWRAEPVTDILGWAQDHRGCTMVLALHDQLHWEQLRRLASVPEASVIALVEPKNDADWAAALRAGAACVLPREASASQLVVAYLATQAELLVLPAQAVEELSVYRKTAAISSHEAALLNDIAAHSSLEQVSTIRQESPRESASILRGIVRRLG